MSDFIRQSLRVVSNLSIDNGWIILGEIEARIKAKVEIAGVPLKNLDIKINYGIKTGFNEAFIIDGAKRNEILKKCPKAAEIIRPILRGRDVQKYKADWANLYLIVSHNGYTNSNGTIIPPINIEEYPAIKDHLDKYIDQIVSRQDKGVTPYNLLSCIYMEDFSKQKIVYPNMTKFLPFYYDIDGFYINQKCFMITGKTIAFLTAFLNSSLFKFCFEDNFPELQGNTKELSKVFFDKIPVIKIDEALDRIFEEKVVQIQNLKKENIETTDLEKEIDEMIFNLYKLTEEEKDAIGFIVIH
jgi:hypothetical protein